MPLSLRGVLVRRLLRKWAVAQDAILRYAVFIHDLDWLDG
jgi:hypothetical protein